MPLDTSEHSVYTLHFYLKFIHRPTNKVYVCYVTEDFSQRNKENNELPTDKVPPKKLWLSCPCCSFDKVVLDVGPSPGVIAELEKAEQLNSLKVKNTVKQFFGANNVNFEFRLLYGHDPWMTIIAFRKEIGGTMIIMGSRGEGSVKRHIFGSVSDKVLHNSLVPLLIVKKPLGAMQSVEAARETCIR